MMTTKTTKSDMTAMTIKEMRMMKTIKSGAWRVARGAMISLLLIAVVGVSLASAAVLAQYSFPTNLTSPAGNINPTTSGAGLTVSPISNGATNVYEVSSNGYASDPELRVGPQATTLGGAVTANSYVQFMLTPDGGNELDLTSLTLNAARGGGATPRGWGLRSSLDGYTTDINGPNDIPTQRPTWTGYNVDLTGGSFQNLTSAITFRIYFYSPAAGSTVEMDDITINGTVTTSGGDTTAPTVTAFNLPATSTSPISVTTFTATDNTAVTGYMITESATPPAAGAAGWTASAPATVSTASTGNVIFYAWAKDAAGNVSSSLNDTVNVTGGGGGTLNSCAMDGDFCSFWTATDSGTTNPWTFRAGQTPSNNVGPSGPQGGSQYVHTEATGPNATDEWYLTSPVIDASTDDYTLDFWYNKYHNGITTCELFVEVSTNGGVSWPYTEWDALALDQGAGGATGTVWNNQSVDLSGYTGGNFMVRFRAASGGNWQCDTALDTVEVTYTTNTAGTCSDGLQNNGEAGVDCGGPCPNACGGCDYAINPAGTYIEAENFKGAIGAANPNIWEVRTNTITDGNGNSNSGDYLYTTTGGTGANPQGSEVDYPITINEAGVYEIWIRAKDQDGAGGGDSVFWGVNGAYVGAITQTADNVWAWSNGVQNGTNRYNFAAGDYLLTLWPREAGQHFDSFVLYKVLESDGTTPSAYASPFTGNNDTTTTEGDLSKSTDPSCIPGGGGGGSGTLDIPDGQGVNGTTLVLNSVVLGSYDPASLASNELAYDPTDLTGIEYRALNGQSDGFHNFSVDPKWATIHIGNDVPNNQPAVNNGTLTMEGSGADIWNTNDYFTYLYQNNISGDFTVDVYIGSLENTNAWAKAGIMAREALTTNSRHAMIVATPGNGARLQFRQNQGGTSTNPTGGNGNGAPKWLRLVREGNVFTGYVSDDGETWVSPDGVNPIDTGTVVMTDPINIGLAVTSHSAGVDATATFKDFMFMRGIPGTPTDSGMESTFTTLSAADGDSFNTNDGGRTAWTDGTYALAMKDDTNIFDVKTFDYSSCTDGTPSTIIIPADQVVSGNGVSLPNLFSHTGNVSSYTYEIEGVSVTNPWNSLAYGNDDTDPQWVAGKGFPVSFRVAGTDPDCGGSQVATTGTIYVNNTCLDDTPSSITILTGQTVGGGSVDLTQLFSSTGDVGSFTYYIDGIAVTSPWNSTDVAKGGIANGTKTVTLEVRGTDPNTTCGSPYTIVALNTITIDNECTVDIPSLSFDRDVNYVGPGRAVPYTVTIRNEDDASCAPRGFTITIDTVNPAGKIDSNFSPSWNVAAYEGIDPTSEFFLDGRGTKTFELAVAADGPPAEWDETYTRLIVTNTDDGGNAGGAHPVVTGDGTVGNGDTEVKTVCFLVSPITHNSVTTDSTKWGGNWGTSQPGSKYGNFDCETCHDKKGGNIKWMRDDIKTEDGSNWGITIYNTLTIEFRDARSSKEILADADPDDEVYWGDDDDDGDDNPNDNNLDTNGGVGRNASNRVCEVCHSITWYHRYNTETAPGLDGVNYGQQGRIDPSTNQPVGLDGLKHFPGRDCTDCHRHSLGFTASCIGCHGDPPLTPELGGPNGLADIPYPTGSVTPGTHYKHTVVLGYACEYCHSGWRDVGQMPDELYVDSAPDHVNAAGRPYQLNPITGTPYQKINHEFNVFFDRFVNTTIDSHATAGRYTGQDNVNYVYNSAYGPTGTGEMDYNGTILGGFGTMTCENIYCHGGSVDDAQPNSNMGGANPKWNGNITCNACHGTSAANTPPGYSHTTHVGDMGLDCTVCHYAGANDQPGYNGHVNGQVEIEMDLASGGIPVTYGTPWYNSPTAQTPGFSASFNSNWNGLDFPPSNQYGTCMNVACHAGNETPVWNNAGQPAACNDCHSDGEPDDGTVADQLQHAAPSSGNHEEHVHPEMAFGGQPDEAIHTNMINTFVGGCQTCHGGGSNTGDHPGHVDFSVDFAGGMSYNSGDGTCTSQCHNLEGSVFSDATPNDPCDDAYVTVTWGSTARLSCEACHMAGYIGPTVVDPAGGGAGMAASGYGSHLKTSKTQSLAGVNWTQQCRACHPYHHDESLSSYGEVTPPPSSWDYPWTSPTEEKVDIRSTLGLNYPVTGMIHLGGCNTTGNNEATICWSCHGADSEINEWGFNNQTAETPDQAQNIALQTTNVSGHGNPVWDPGAANRSHNYGYVYTSSNWTTGPTSAWVDASGFGYYIRDAYQHSTETTPSYLMSRRIASVHSVNFDPAKQVSSVATGINTSGTVIRTTAQEKPEDIRCSYCHDVHDLNRAVDVDTLAQETSTGAPYLRGTWWGNPYAPDMPPLDSYTFPVNGHPSGQQNDQGTRFRSAIGPREFTDSVPRLWSTPSLSVKGGYFIDQNSNWPTFGGSPAVGNEETLANTAGVCINCHDLSAGSGMTVDTLDFYNSFNVPSPLHTTNMWRGGGNGHSNSTLEGTNLAASNTDLFSANRGTGAQMANQNRINQNQWGVGQGLDNASSSANYPFRSSWVNTVQADGAANSPPRVTGFYGGTPGSTSTAGTQYSNWYGSGTIGTDGTVNLRAHNFTCSKCHSPHAAGLPALLITNCLDVLPSNWVGTGTNNHADPMAKAANNCHRKENAAQTTSGWHILDDSQ